MGVEVGEVVAVVVLAALVVLASVHLAAVQDVEIFKVAATLEIAKVRVRRGDLLKAIALKAIVPEVSWPVRLLRQVWIQ